MLKKRLFLVVLVIIILVFANQLVKGDRLLQRSNNYFELEVDSSGTTTTSKFFPVGPWYPFKTPDTLINTIVCTSGVCDTVEDTSITCDSCVIDTIVIRDGVLDAIDPDSSKMNVFVPTCHRSMKAYIQELQYGIDTLGLYAFSSFGDAIGKSVYSIDQFDNFRIPTGTDTYIPFDSCVAILRKIGWECSPFSLDTSDADYIDSSQITFTLRTPELDSSVQDTMDYVYDSTSPNNIGNGAIHFISDSVCTLSLSFDNSYTPHYSKPWILESFGYECDWLSFKVRSDTDFSSSDTFKFIAEYISHKVDTTESTRTIYVELNSKSQLLITEGYDTTTSTVTVSLQNPSYFGDPDGESASFPLYGRNPDPTINLYTPEHDWFIVFAQMDKIIYDFTDTAGTPYILDSLVSVKVVGKHFYFDNLGFTRNPDDVKGECASFIDSMQTDANLANVYDDILCWYVFDEPHLRARRAGHVWWRETWEEKCAMTDFIKEVEETISTVDTLDKPMYLKLTESWNPASGTDVPQVFANQYKLYNEDNLYDFTISEDGLSNIRPDDPHPSPYLVISPISCNLIKAGLDSAGLADSTPFIITAVAAVGKEDYCYIDSVPSTTRRVASFEELTYMTFSPIVHGARGLLWWGVPQTLPDSLNANDGWDGACNDTLLDNIKYISRYLFENKLDAVIMDDELNSYVSCLEDTSTHDSVSLVTKDINYIFRQFDIDTTILGEENYLIATNDMNVTTIAKELEESSSKCGAYCIMSDICCEFETENLYDSSEAYCYDSVTFILDSLDNAYWRVVDIRPYDDDGYPAEWPGQNHADAWASGDDNSICIYGNSFTDFFRPYDVHIYKIYQNPPVVLDSGWNMISIPYATGEDSLSKILGDPLGIWALSGRDYIEVSDTFNFTGKGYWVLIDHDTTIQMDYQPIKQYTASIDAGWNLIGSVHSTYIWDTTTYCL